MDARTSTTTASTTTPPVTLVEVLLPIAVDRSFVYRVPEELESLVRPGVQVEVPFRRRTVTGVVVARGGTAPSRGLRDVAAVPDPELTLPGEVLEFTRWVARYYGAAWGEALRAALPSDVGRPGRAARDPGPGADPGSTPPPTTGVSPHTLTAGQTRAVARLEERLAAGGFGVVLLHGVTASGKTEVYMRAAARARAAGGQVLVLVPEISISVQLLDRFRERFGDVVHLYHSDLPVNERRRAWRAALRDEGVILIGARSAVFAPFRSLRLVVVDEEHEAAYKQAEQPRYHARDAAIMRARMNKALAVLGSATPGLESAHNAERQRYELVRLESRVDSRPLATVELADMRRLREEERARADEERRRRRRALRAQRLRAREARLRGEVTASPAAPRVTTGAPASPALDEEQAPAVFMTERLLQALEETLTRREQAILLVGRRGFSTFVQCTDCGQVSRCPDCEVSLVYHREGDALRCHHCGRRERRPEACEICTGDRFWLGGAGTQRVQDELARRLPRARVLRMDLDSTRRTGSHRRIVEQFAAGRADVLLGTQMVAKGLHFPEVSLVGVVSADTQLNLPDFRASERTFQLLTQVAGRAGRGASPGRVLIQTYVPDHPVIRAASTQDYDAFYTQEIEERRELGYPPAGVMARFLVDGTREDEVEGVVERLRVRVGAPGGVRVFGPAPLPLARVRRRHRWHLTLLGSERSVVARVARATLDGLRRSRVPAGVRLHLDMDPVHLL